MVYCLSELVGGEDIIGFYLFCECFNFSLI